MIRTLAFPVLALLVGPSAAMSQEIEIDGFYMGSGEGVLTADFVHIEGDRYAVSISTTVPISEGVSGCGGSINGEAVLDRTGGVLRVENEDYDPAASTPSRRAAPYCEIALTLDGSGGLELEEGEGCMNYHGAGCGFNGQLVHHAAGL